jgi:hypothetical protein
MDARKTAGSKSKSTISDLLLSETARQIACQLAPQKRPNSFKNIAGVLVVPPIPSICVSILHPNLEQPLAHETIKRRFA